MSGQVFSHTESQLLLEQSLGRYLKDCYSMEGRRAAIDSEQGFSREHWTFFAELGLLGLPFREADGGVGGSLAEVMSAMRLFGDALVVEPYFHCIIMAGRLLSHSSDIAQKSRWLPGLIAGEALVGLAHWERNTDSAHSSLRTRFVADGQGLVLNGSKVMVPVVGSLDAVLVSALDQSGKMVIGVVPCSCPGVRVRPCKTIDGHAFGDFEFDNVRLQSSDLLVLDDPAVWLEETISYGRACLCSEATGIMKALLDMTLEHVRTRKQFGVALGSFQVLKHRLVDCYTLWFQAQACVDSLGLEGGSGWLERVSAAKAFIGKHALDVGHEAIQMHGGMGLTDELAVSHYHKRLVVLSQLLGDSRYHLERVANSAAFFRTDPESVAPAFAALLDLDADNFRREVLSFLDENLTAELRRSVRSQVSTFPEPDVTNAWRKCLASRGWLAPHWPTELGGTGWSPVQRFIYEYYAGLFDAPEQIPMGFRYVGPVIAHFGSDWQKRFFLPKLLSGEHYWAQGFSEPSAGSDLAALETTATLEGDGYLISGQKIWTTHAHHANWLFCLARTDKTVRPQQGIGFFLIELNTPGIRIDPIPLMAGPREVNQVFLDNVRIPVSQLVGDPARGWEYTKFLLEYERGGTVFSGRARSELNRVKELVTERAGERGCDPVLLRETAALEARVMALELVESRHAMASRDGAAPGVGGSMTKLLASELRKDISQLAVEVAGLAALEYHNDILCREADRAEFPGTDLELAVVPRYLNLRADSIYGGTSEIQREILARQLLGLR